MALVKFGGGVVGMSGSIAGTTFARNRSGSYARARTKPINPNTARQVLVRSIMANLSTRWSQTLTADQRTAWNLYASSVSMKNRLGEAINLTGFNHYLRSNSNRLAEGIALIDAGPTVFELAEKDSAIEISPDASRQMIDLTFDDTMEWVDEDEAWLFIQQGRPQNAQRNFFAGPYFDMKDKHGDSGAPLTTPESFSATQVITEGQKLWCKFQIARADGRISEPFFASAIVVA